ncbi:MAG: PAS domain-containing sensor histidine kinase [Alkalinema sp. CAN_BIN05]|nr:PAS domain-containing sensor histidine kinase [Alkalinema sp. CAN_BIN05]
MEFLLGLGIGGLGLLIYRMRLLKTLQRATDSVTRDCLGSELPNSAIHKNGASHDDLNRSRSSDKTTGSLSVTSQLLRALDLLLQRNLFLEQQVSDWKAIVSTLPVGYLQVDEDNQLIWSNSAALELLDIQDYEMDQPRLLMEVVRSYDLDSLIDQARSINKVCQREWNHYPASVNVAHVTTPTAHPLRAYALPLQRGNQVGVILESRAEAQALSQQRDRWTSDVAHELKTPLTSIRLVAETLQSRLEPPLRTWVDRLLVESIRLSTLVQEILDLSHLETAGTRPLKATIIDLPQLIRSAWLTLEPIASAKLITLTYKGPDALRLQGEDARLHRVLVNLLDNSIKYTLPERPILLQLSLIQDPAMINGNRSTESDAKPRTNATLIQIDLIDGGVGFPEEDLPFVFERFYRADPSRSRNTETYAYGQEERSIIANESPSSRLQTQTQIPIQLFQPSSGSGLGLAIVRQIVELHKGTITARNHPEGGAWIQIRLPQKQ